MNDDIQARLARIEAAFAEAHPLIAARYEIGTDEEWRAFARRINDVPPSEEGR